MVTSGWCTVDPEAQELVIDFDGRLVNYDFGELDEIVPAYAITIHKSQGSEYPAVVIPAFDPALFDAAAQSGLHRYYAGQAAGGAGRAAQGLTLAVKDSRAERRWSKLHQWLHGEAALDPSID
jgi:exodeoxyribonuclease V alpha subunit